MPDPSRPQSPWTSPSQPPFHLQAFASLFEAFVPSSGGWSATKAVCFEQIAGVRSNVKLNCLLKYYIRSFADTGGGTRSRVIWVSGSMGMRSDCGVKMNEIDVLWASKWRNCNVKWVSSWSIKCFHQDALSLKFRAHKEIHLNLSNYQFSDILWGEQKIKNFPVIEKVQQRHPGHRVNAARGVKERRYRKKEGSCEIMGHCMRGFYINSKKKEKLVYSPLFHRYVPQSFCCVWHATTIHTAL